MKIVVGFSGGADSQACLGWCRDKFGDDDVIALNSDAGGNEHELTTAFVQEFSAKVFPIVTVKAIVADLQGVGTKEGATRDRRATLEDAELLTFDKLAFVKGRFPSRKAQFCTLHLKVNPQVRWCNENLIAQGLEFERFVGLRCDESAARKDTPARRWDETFGTWVNYPIRCWTKAEVFSYLKHRGEGVNQLYKMGFSRVGCAPCINIGKDDVRNWASRFPHVIDKVRSWEREVGRTFFPPCVPGLRINWIDDVVAWSKTSHGGKQPLLMFEEAEAASGVCSSLYGLCE